MSKKKYYVVWNGVTPGIYDSWADCQLQIKGYPGARYASFKTMEMAQTAYESDYASYLESKPSKEKTGGKPLMGYPEETKGSWCVDAACSGNPGKMEYRCVETDSADEIFHFGPVEYGTNNIGEFLALVHAAALLQKIGRHEIPIYTDSKIAMGWVEKKNARTKLKKTKATAPLWSLIDRAETWLKANKIRNPIRKWNTREWGEIPADFGRK